MTSNAAPDQVDSGGGGPEGPSTGAGTKRSAVPWIIGLVVVLVLGGGAIAVRAALGESDGQPAGALPSSAVAYARIDIDPSAGQKVQALRLANRFPAFGDATGITDPDVDLRARLFEEIRADAPGLADLDFAEDVEPWLGSRIGIAVLAPEGDDAEPGFAVAVQVTDQGAAEDGIARLAAAGGDVGGTDADGAEAGGESAGYAFAAGYAVFAETQELADRYVAAAEESSLADDEEFQADMTALGDEGVASAWMSSDAWELFSDAASMGMGGGDAGALGSVGGMTGLPFASGSAAYALRFDDRFVEVAMVGSGGELAVAGDAGESPITRLPESTLFAMSVANGDEYVRQSWEQLRSVAEETGQNVERQIKRFENQTGLALPDDLATLFGDHLTIAVDSDLGNIEDPAGVRVGALLDTDTEAAQGIIDKLVTLAGGAFEVETLETDGLLAVSVNEAYAAELTGGSLGDTDAFDLAVAYGAGSDFAMFFNIDELEGLDLFTQQADAEQLENVTPMQAVGLSVDMTEDGEVRASFRLTVNE